MVEAEYVGCCVVTGELILEAYGDEDDADQLLRWVIAEVNPW